MEELKINNLLNLQETIAKEIFENITYPWEVIPKIEQFIVLLGNKLNPEIFKKQGDNIWIAKNANISNTASIIGPCIIDENAEIRHSAYIRENVIIGKNATIGNSTELKNSILFNKVEVPHFNYVGDSILGYKAHMGASSIVSNLKSDKSLVTLKINDKIIQTNLKKFGAIIADDVQIGCGAVINPGSVLGKNSNIYPLSSVRGYVPENSIYKNKNEIVEKRI